MSAKRIPIDQITNPSGIAHAIRAREARMGDAKECLANGTNPNGVPLTSNKAMRLRQLVRDCERELGVLYDKRDEFEDARNARAAAKATAQGAPSSTLTDWE